MSKLPQLNLRIAPQHHELIRQIATRLRESNGDAVAAGLSAFLADAPHPVTQADTSDLEARLAALEAKVEALTPPPAQTKRIVRKV